MDAVIGWAILGLLVLGTVTFVRWVKRVFNVGCGPSMRDLMQTPYGAACIFVAAHKDELDKGNLHLRQMLFAYKQAFDILCGYRPDQEPQPSDCIGQAMVRGFVRDFVRPMEEQWQEQQISDADLYVFYEGAFPRVAPWAKGGPGEPSARMREG